MTIAKVTPWVQPAPFKVDADDLGLSEDKIRELVDYCIDNENMYDYMDGDFTAVFDLDDPDEEIADSIEIIKQHLPADYKETYIGVWFCNG